MFDIASIVQARARAARTTGRGSVLAPALLGASGGATAETRMACVGSTGELAAAVSACDGNCILVDGFD